MGSFLSFVPCERHDLGPWLAKSMDSLVQLTLVRRLFTLNLNFPLQFSCSIDVVADDLGLRLNMAISAAKVSLLLPSPHGPTIGSDHPCNTLTNIINTQPRLACHYVPLSLTVFT